jgi:hypothetical protein
MNRLLKTLLILFIFNMSAHSQTTWHHVSDRGIYQFLDELAGMHLIDISTTVKPYAREAIADALVQASRQWTKLTLSQRSRLDLYMNEFAMERDELKTGYLPLYRRDTVMSVHLLTPEVSRRDSMFRLLVRPVYGYRNFSGGNQNFWVTYGGAEAIAYMGKRWTAYASLRDNYQSGQKLAQPSWLTQEPGGTYKGQTGGGSGGEFSEMRGGITYTWNWGSFGLVKDHLQWGDNYNGSNIFSGRTPSFAMVKLNIHPARWLEFNYYHGWLVSEAIDSMRSYFVDGGVNRLVNRQMYIAANMLTLKPMKRLHISMGNSIVYGDMDVQPAYLIPVFFYKSVVHTLHWGASLQNNAMFFNISSRQIKHLHLYANYFIDEFSIRRVRDPGRHNFTSFKGGFSLTDWPVSNVVLMGEYTFNNPITFLHDEPTTSFSSNRYNLGHYLKDNAEEYFGAIRIYPFSTLELGASWVQARKGNYYQYIRKRRNPRIDEMPVLQDITWTNHTLSLDAVYRPVANLRLFGRYSFSDIQGYEADGKDAAYYLRLFSPAYLHGKNNILELGFGLGF